MLAATREGIVPTTGVSPTVKRRAQRLHSTAVIRYQGRGDGIAWKGDGSDCVVIHGDSRLSGPRIPGSAALVALETERNQRYIFATNRLRENVGASERVRRLGAIVVESAESLAGLLTDGQVDREKLLDSQPLGPGVPYEVVTAGSGQALVLAETEAHGRQLVRAVTERFLCDAPSLTACGAVVPFGDRSLGDCMTEAVDARARVRAGMPAPELRFARLPFAADCRYSGFPAYAFDQASEGRKGAPVSRVSLAKADAGVVDHALARLRGPLGPAKGLVPENATTLDSRTRRPGENAWLAVIHADGNGLGEILQKFEALSGTQGDRRACVDSLRRFSVGLDLCTEAAFEAAAYELHRLTREKGFLPLLPLVLGGDDLTLMMDGRHALHFTATFLRHLERGPTDVGGRRGEAIAQVRRILAAARDQLGKDRYAGTFTACAGVAVVKPHYPFHVAYDLAEQLLESAKLKKPQPALDFHVLYDTTDVRLEDLRDRLQRRAGGVQLSAKPYTLERFDVLAKNVDRVNERVGPGAIPRTVLAELREAALLGREEADRRLAFVSKRVADTCLPGLYPESLFSAAEGGGPEVTDFLDLLEAARVSADG
jgi:hypothetical protein